MDQHHSYYFPRCANPAFKASPHGDLLFQFQIFLQSHGMRYSNDLMDIGRYYLAYDELMQCHMADHGDAITTIDYDSSYPGSETAY